MISKTRASQAGLSLIELMIAIALGIFITAAMISLFVNSKQSFRINENMSRLQENGRFAVSYLSRDIPMADYRACTVANQLNNAVSGTDGIIVDPQTGYESVAPDTVTIVYQTNACGTANATTTTVYSIQTGSSGNPALFRNIDGTSQELVDGIEDLQFLYGEDTDNDKVPNHYVDVTSITDMAQVISIRFTLIARTLEANITADGGRATRAFSSTITLRNRLP